MSWISKGLLIIRRPSIRSSALSSRRRGDAFRSESLVVERHDVRAGDAEARFGEAGVGDRLPERRSEIEARTDIRYQRRDRGPVEARSRQEDGCATDRQQNRGESESVVPRVERPRRIRDLVVGQVATWPSLARNPENASSPSKPADRSAACARSSRLLNFSSGGQAWRSRIHATASPGDRRSATCPFVQQWRVLRSAVGLTSTVAIAPILPDRLRHVKRVGGARSFGTAAGLRSQRSPRRSWPRHPTRGHDRPRAGLLQGTATPATSWRPPSAPSRGCRRTARRPLRAPHAPPRRNRRAGAAPGSSARDGPLPAPATR